jgi:hypothetical protein
MHGNNIAFTANGMESSSGQGCCFGLYFPAANASGPIVSSGTAIPGTSRTFASWTDLRVDNQTVAFDGAAQGGGNGIYLYSAGQIQPLVVPNQTALPDGQPLASLAGHFARSGDNIAFNAFHADTVGASHGVYLKTNQGIRRMVDTSTRVPNFPEGVPADDTFRSVALATIDGENVAFVGQWRYPSPSPTSRLYASMNGSLIEVADATGGLDFSNGAQAMSGNTIVFSRGNAIYRADLINLSPPRPPIPDRAGYHDLQRPPGSTAKSAIILVHGWNDSTDLFTSANTPNPDDLLHTNMKATLEAGLGSRLGTEYDVFAYDWSEDAEQTPAEMQSGFIDSNRPSGRVERWAELHGAHLARQIADLGYTDNVHLIAHSLGGRVIDRATFHLRESTWPGMTHVTFLDAYTPHGWEDEFGSHANFADSYYFDNAGAVLTNTEDTILDSLNVDITNILDQSGENNEDHKWPVRWYNRTIVGANPIDEGFGYPLSREANETGWPRSDLIGHSFSLPLPLHQQLLLRIIRNRQEHNPMTAQLGSSATGQVIFDVKTAEMRTGSEVWFNMTLDISESANIVEFDYEFVSDAAGVLSIYVNDDLVGLIDEEYSFDGTQSSGLLFLPETLQAGTHVLSFRLDPLTDDMSVISLSQIESGLVVRALPGDYNDDGVVDAADYAVWRNNVGAPAGTLLNDGDGGTIGQAHYDTWRANFGMSLPVPPPANASIPEPVGQALVLLASATVGLWWRLRRVSNRMGLTPANIIAAPIELL